MLISLAAPNFDLDGAVMLKATLASVLGDTDRRVSRSATLDGGVVLTDFGFSHGDRTLEVVVAEISPEDYALLAYLHQTYPLLTLSCDQGHFIGCLQSLRPKDGGVTCSYLVKEKLA